MGLSTCGSHFAPKNLRFAPFPMSHNGVAKSGQNSYYYYYSRVSYCIIGYTGNVIRLIVQWDMWHVFFFYYFCAWLTIFFFYPMSVSVQKKKHLISHKKVFFPPIFLDYPRIYKNICNIWLETQNRLINQSLYNQATIIKNFDWRMFVMVRPTSGLRNHGLKWHVVIFYSIICSLKKIYF